MEQYNEAEYIQKLTEQIRCKEARELVVREVKNHIEDQMGAYIEEGMEEESARKEAVHQMGDPIEVGLNLNKIHRPKMEWTIVFTAIALLLFGLFLQFVIAGGFQQNFSKDISSREEFWNQVVYVLVGIGMMGAFYVFDYTFIGRYPLLIWLLLVFTIYIKQHYMIVNDSFQNDIYQLSLLFIPIFGGIIYYLKELKYKGILLSSVIFWASIIYFYKADRKINGVIVITTACIILFSYLIIKGIFHIKKWVGLLIVWGSMVFAPALFIIGGFVFENGLTAYMRMRLHSFIHMRDYQDGYQFLNVYIQRLIINYNIFGGSNADQKSIPNINKDYAVTAIFSYFGIAIAMLIIGIIAFFIFKILRISLKQKNPLGSAISLGCGVILFMESLIYIVSNIGLKLISQIYMPFLSYGFGGTVVNCILIGLILSIYRNTNVIDEKQKLKKKRIIPL